ncbi:MAG: hypothetical protein IJ068_06715 [Bacilli bacterium]|nr:hypothetical protein [Bacilli bacterium]
MELKEILNNKIREFNVTVYDIKTELEQDNLYLKVYIMGENKIDFDTLSAVSPIISATLQIDCKELIPEDYILQVLTNKQEN